MKPIPFALRHPLAVLAVVLGAVVAGSYQQVRSTDLIAQETRIDCAESRNNPQSAPIALHSHPGKEISRAIARSVIAARLIRRREKAGAVRLALHSHPPAGVLPLLKNVPNLFAWSGHATFVCHGMAAASWGLPGVLLSRNDRAPI
jgi:hypothetical protein